MKRIPYRLEPLVRVSEIARRVARRRVVAASRAVRVRRHAVLTGASRLTSVTAQARSLLDEVERDILAVRSSTASRVNVLLAVAQSAQVEVDIARRSLWEATRAFDRRVDEARISERDARCQRSAREAFLARARESARRHAERTEAEDAITTWLATRRDVDRENSDAR